MDDGFLRIEHLADLDGDLRLLVLVRENAEMLRRRADADDTLEIEIVVQLLLDLLGDLVNFLVAVRGTGQLLDEDEIRLVDTEDEVLLPVGEHVGNGFERGHIGALRLADQQNGTGYVRSKVQLFGADVDISRQDIVGDDVLDEDRLVVLFLVIDLCLLKSDRGKDAHAARRGVMAIHKDGIIQPRAQPADGLICAEIGREDLIGIIAEAAVKIIELRADHGKLAARGNDSLIVHNADAPVGGILHLDDDALENPAGHNVCLPHLSIRKCSSKNLGHF